MLLKGTHFELIDKLKWNIMVDLTSLKIEKYDK